MSDQQLTPTLQPGQEGSPSPGKDAMHAASGQPHGRETTEREAAWRRGEEYAQRVKATGAGAAGELALLRRTAASAVHGLAQRAFAALADNVRDYAVFLLDPAGVITYWGEGARLIKWWTKEQAEGGHLRMLYPDGGSNDGTAEEHLQAAAELGEYTGEGHRVRSDGSTFWAGVTLTALRDDEGRLIGFAKVTRDLTARRAAEEAWARALAAEEGRAAAVEADRVKSSFLATMSHEIRTPLQAIIGYQRLLSMELGGSLSPQQREYVTRAMAATKHLLGLINEVLDFSSIEAGRAEVARAMFGVGPLINAAVDLVRPQAAARELTLDDAVSGYAAKLVCWGDEDRARQILVNLLGNAVKFTEPGGGVKVSAGASTDPPGDALLPGDGPWVYVRVEDTGPGIPAERLAKLFEPFVQGNTSLTRRHGGSGLGLAISRRLARLMGGDVTVRSRVGVGSTFFLWLPAAPPNLEPTGAVASAAPPT